MTDAPLRNSVHETLPPLGQLPSDFDSSLYLWLNPDVAVSGADPAEHYVRQGRAEGRLYRLNSEDLASLPDDFDGAIYMEINPDLAGTDLEPTLHYMLHGWREGRSYRTYASEVNAPLEMGQEQGQEQEQEQEQLPDDFDPDLYLKANPDIAAAGVDPVWHYLQRAKIEGRSYRPVIDPLADDFEPNDFIDTRPSPALRTTAFLRDGTAAWPPQLWNPGLCDQPRMQRNRAMLSYFYLRGCGLEVKAMNSPLALRRGTTAVQLEDLATAQMLKTARRFAGITTVGAQMLCNTTTLESVADRAYDFVVLNHALHFCEDVIDALRHAARVTRPGGVIYIAVGDKRYGVDARRAVTPIRHFWDDFNSGPLQSRRAHYQDFYDNVLVPIAGTASLAARGVHAERLLHERQPVHFHVWTNGSFLGLLQSVVDTLPMGCEIELTVRNEVETICLLRKAPAGDP